MNIFPAAAHLSTCTFEEYLKKTEVETEEWIVGGTFTGFSSEQGYGIIVNILRGERALSELDD